MTSKYDKIQFRGRTFDRYTKAGIEHFEYMLGHGITILQGSFNTSVGASAGTHKGSGAIDIAPIPGIPDITIQSAGRRAGWALWHRPELWSGGVRVWGEHFHGIQVGNIKVSPDAKKQLFDYHAHRNALSNHLHDPTWHPNPILALRYPLAKVDIKVVQRESRKKKGWTKNRSTVHIQRLLNLRLNTDLVVDGVFGPKTKAVYARYEREFGGDGNGIPGLFALKPLGACRFRVVNTD